uniref:Uncharacterized protein n=1 Tax=Panagrolaimus davidi TaxID=227884 RepID=A0A914QBX6_9BILA
MNGTLYVPPSKDHTCEPRNWAEIQRLQREYKKNMGRKRGRTVKAETTTIKRAKVVEKGNESNPEDYDAEDSYMDSSNVVEPQIIADMSKVNKAEILTKFSSSASFNTVSFYSPSAFFLSNCCKELNIKYSNDAYKFWSHILIEKVKATSRPLTVHKTKEAMYHGFSCLSLYFTGTEANTAIIREMVNRYVYNNFKTLGNCMGHDFSQYSHETPIIREALWSFALTGIHLECLSRWFECRIAIFEGKKWKRYGNWDAEESAAPIFIMEVKDGKYNPILTLA